MASKGFAINLACTGAIHTKSITPKVPISHEEILADIEECLSLGVQMFHLHARDEEGKQTADPEPYGRLIEAIRKLTGGRDSILCVTTTGRHESAFEFRSQVLDLDGDMKPDMASLTLSSLNFMQTASINPPDTIRELAQKMLTKKIRPELEIFDLGMVNFVTVLIKEKLITSPCYINLLLGNIAGAQNDPLHAGTLLASLPTGCFTSIAGLGRYQLQSNLLGLLFADGIRIGLEDNIWLDQTHQQYASNAALVKRVLRIANELERPLLQRNELRTTLGLGNDR